MVRCECVCQITKVVPRRYFVICMCCHNWCIISSVKHTFVSQTNKAKFSTGSYQYIVGFLHVFFPGIHLNLWFEMQSTIEILIVIFNQILTSKTYFLCMIGAWEIYSSGSNTCGNVSWRYYNFIGDCNLSWRDIERSTYGISKVLWK